MVSNAHRKTAGTEFGPHTALANEGVLIIDGSLRPIGLDIGAEAILSRLSNHRDGHETGEALPEELLTLLDSSSESGRNHAPGYLKAGGCDYSCRAFAVKRLRGTEPILIVHFRREVSFVEAVHHVAAEYGLTDREEEALRGISMGLTSKELAARMKISPNTVKAFLRLVMIKLGASSRVGIVAKLFDRQAG